MIEAVVPRGQLREAVEVVTDMVPPPAADDDGGWRAEMASHYPTVSGFVKLLTGVIKFDANPEGERVLAASADRCRFQVAAAVPVQRSMTAA
ncbi:hypothetical protein [Nonomuraea sp. NPDC004354]